MGYMLGMPISGYERMVAFGAAGDERTNTAVVLYTGPDGTGTWRSFDLKPKQQVEMRDLKNSGQWYGSAWLPPNMWMHAFGDINWDKRWAGRYPWNEFSSGSQGQLIGNIGRGLPAVYHIVIGSNQTQEQYERFKYADTLSVEKNIVAIERQDAERIAEDAAATKAALERARAEQSERERLQMEYAKEQSARAAAEQAAAQRESELARTNEALRAERERAAAIEAYRRQTGQAGTPPMVKYGVPIAAGVAGLLIVFAMMRR